MLNDTIKNMQMIICQAINSENYYAAYEALIIYVNTFSMDDFAEQNKWLINNYGPQVSVICLDNDEESINKFVELQTYKNIELVKLSEEDSYADIIEYMKTTDSKYICFWENSCLYDINKISEMVWNLECNQKVNMAISPRLYADSNNNIIAHKDMAYKDTLNNVIISGRNLVEYCIENEVNLYGTLSNIMISQNSVKHINFDIPDYDTYEIKRLSLLFQMCVASNVLYMERVLLAAKQQIKCEELTVKNEFKKLIGKIDLKRDEDIEVEKIWNLTMLKRRLHFSIQIKGNFII